MAPSARSRSDAWACRDSTPSLAPFRCALDALDRDASCGGAGRDGSRDLLDPGGAAGAAGARPVIQRSSGGYDRPSAGVAHCTASERGDTPFLREMTTQLATALVHSEAQARLLVAMQCGPGAPPLLGLPAGGTWARHVGVQFQLAPCAAARMRQPGCGHSDARPGLVAGRAAAAGRCGAGQALAPAAPTPVGAAGFRPCRAAWLRFDGGSVPTRRALGLPRR